MNSTRVLQEVIDTVRQCYEENSDRNTLDDIYRHLKSRGYLFTKEQVDSAR